MRSPLLWAALLLAAPVLAQDFEFSHELHLTLASYSCDVCHSAAGSSTKAADRLLPSEETCLECHQGQTARPVNSSGLDEVELPDRTFWFNHQFHASLGNLGPVIAAAIDSGKYLGQGAEEIRPFLDSGNSCAACHRGLEKVAFADAKNMPQMSDCLVCHSDVDPPFSCEKCHMEGVNLKPDNHTLNFVDTHSTGKLGLDKATCKPCHGTNFACMGCH